MNMLINVESTYGITIDNEPQPCITDIVWRYFMLKSDSVDEASQKADEYLTACGAIDGHYFTVANGG